MKQSRFFKNKEGILYSFRKIDSVNNIYIFNVYEDKLTLFSNCISSDFYLTTKNVLKIFKIKSIEEIIMYLELINGDEAFIFYNALLSFDRLDSHSYVDLLPKFEKILNKCQRIEKIKKLLN